MECGYLRARDVAHGAWYAIGLRLPGHYAIKFQYPLGLGIVVRTFENAPFS